MWDVHLTYIATYIYNLCSHIHGMYGNVHLIPVAINAIYIPTYTSNTYGRIYLTQINHHVYLIYVTTYI